VWQAGCVIEGRDGPAWWSLQLPANVDSSASEVVFGKLAV
jgi:hypothetical protein